MECCSGLRADTTPIAEARPCSGTCRRVPNCSTPDISAAAGNLGGEGKESKNYSACAVRVARLAGVTVYCVTRIFCRMRRNVLGYFVTTQDIWSLYTIGEHV